jgi:hypothetical protein
MTESRSGPSVLRRSLIAGAVGLAAIPAATKAYSARSVPRARRTPRGFETATVLRPEMFGSTESVADTTAALRAAFDVAIASGRPIELLGRYLVNGPITANTSQPRAALDLRLDGDVLIEVVPESQPIEYLLIAASAAGDSHSITGGSLTIRCNRRVQRAVSLVSNSGGTVRRGRVSIEAPVRIHDVHAPLHSNGIAYAMTIIGPYSEVLVQRLDVNGVSRHPLLSRNGDCKGLLIAEALGPVTVSRPTIRNILDAVQDADGLFVKAPLINDSPVGPLARIIDGVFEDCQGRSIKTQVSHTEVIRPVFRRRSVVSIPESCDIDTQYGSLDVIDWRAEYRRRGGVSPLGRNHRPFFIQTLYADSPRHSRIGTGELVTEVSMLNLVYVNVGPASPDQSVLVENTTITPSRSIPGGVFRDGLLGYAASGVARTRHRFEIDIRTVSGPRGMKVCSCDSAVARTRPNIQLRIAPPLVIPG